MKVWEWKRILLIVAGIAFTSSGHYLVPTSSFWWHAFFQHLYSLPIVYAGISFGWRGGLLAAIISCAAYSPHIFMASSNPAVSASQFSEVLIFLLVGIGSGIFSDRERKREIQLSKTAEDLERANRELQESFERLRQADRLSAIGKLAASLAHEIRNPLASIEGATKILQRTSISEEMMDEFAGIIQKECRRLNRLLTNLLAFGKPTPPNYRDVSIDTVVDGLLHLAAPEAAKHGITLQKNVSPNLPRLVCDPDQLTQLLLNLALNAIQSMPQGGEIVFDVGKVGESIALQVKDQGVGIEAKDLEKIFDPFFTTKGDGTGLGLSICHHIVTQHGGTLMVGRNPDKGMTFTITLPVAPQGRSL